MSELSPVRFQQFEREVILPSARVLPLIFSAVAILMLVSAGIGLVYSFTPASKPEPPAKIEPISITPWEVSEFVKRGTSAKPAEQSSANAQPAPNPDALALATELLALKTRASALMLTWTDQQETRCRQKVYGVCLGEHRVLISRGVEGYVQQAFGPYDDNSQEPEIVSVSGITYRVNISEAQTKIAIVKELEAVLTKASPTDAARVLEGWAALRQEREVKRAEALSAAHENQAADQRAYEAAVANRQQTRTWSLWSALLALGVFVLLGLILAVLAIERHTRMLEQIRQAG
jgi:hypothetical protein